MLTLAKFSCLVSKQSFKSWNYLICQFCRKTFSKNDWSSVIRNIDKQIEKFSIFNLNLVHQGSSNKVFPRCIPSERNIDTRWYKTFPIARWSPAALASKQLDLITFFLVFSRIYLTLALYIIYFVGIRLWTRIKSLRPIEFILFLG